MDRQTVIKVDHVSIKFNLSSEKFDSFKEYVIKSIKKQVSFEEFWALKDVSFEVLKGDSLGLIGLNGSGKSTMLKTIAGVLKPTEGSVTVNGIVAPLIELGAGFDFDLTAKENIYLNGVPANIGPCPNEWLGSVDLILHGTSKSVEDSSYGGGFLLKDILEGKDIDVKVEAINGDIIESTTNIGEITRAQMIANNDMEFSKDQTDNYINSIKKISTGIPIQYITNNQEFMNLNFYVDENVLIPQPDTETLVEEVINEYKEKKCEILDLCTGSGAIAISLAKYINESNIVASDISMKALQIAKLNAEKNLVRKKIEFIESDMFNKIYKDDFDIIVSNPPYIKTKVIGELDKQVKNEPYIALDGGADGLKFYKIIIENAYKYIKNEGKVFLEIGYDQKNELINLFKKNNHYENIYSKKDLGGNDRIIVATVRR